MTHKTKGIVLRTIKYGETSVITSVYTELFGLQSYIVKGARQSTKKTQPKQIYFQPGAILEMEVYHNELKNLQFIKEYKWSYLYNKVLFDVVRNAIVQFMIELFLHAVKQPEANPELFYLLEGSLLEADKGTDTIAANLPLYFILHLATESGFELQGSYSRQSPVLDLKEGIYTEAEPPHRDFVSGALAASVSAIRHIQFYNDLELIKLNRQARREILDALLQYISYHITDFRELKSLAVLREVLE
ncbi:MAG TPA: DNA repair protein RecO [Parafilimonas sp.]|nr:DNA repair protein RecO [Parafilimonas sp.]